MWEHIAVAAAAGVLLNFTPCVLPVIPIKLRAIASAVGGTPGRRLLAGTALLAGSLTFFGALALATAWLNWTWGTLFQASGFRLGLAALLGLLGAASLAGRGMQPPQWVYRLHGRGFTEPYLAGLLAAVLSTPCTGPFLGGVLAFALTQSPAAILALFLAIGTGIALPYLLLLAHPAWLARLPREGAWLTRVQQLLGLVLLAGAAFFGATALPAWTQRLLWTAWTAVAVFWVLRAVWMGPGLGARLVPALAVAGTLAAMPMLIASPGQIGTLAWQPLNAQRLDAARAASRPVLVEFTADWCINCKVLERTVYQDEAVVTAARRADMVALQADLTRPVPRLQKRLRDYGGAGLPFAVVLDADGKVLRRLPDMFSADTLIRAIRDTQD